MLPKGKLVAIGGKVKQGAAKITKKSGQVGMNVLRNRENRNSRAKAGGAENANGEEEQNGKKVNRFLGSVVSCKTNQNVRQWKKKKNRIPSLCILYRTIHHPSHIVRTPSRSWLLPLL